MNDQVPKQVAQVMADHPDKEVTVMQWEPEYTFPPLEAKTVSKYVKFVQSEFVKLLHTTNDADENLRTRLRTHPPVDAFAQKYAMVFDKITNREIATNPRLMTPILYQLYLLEQVQAGKMTEQQAKASVSESALSAVVSEARSRGAHMETNDSESGDRR